MQSTAKFSKRECAKYPFLKEAAEYIKLLDLKIEDLIDPNLGAILERAEERLQEAILYNFVSRRQQPNEDIEIMSFPTAIMLAIATKNTFIQKRYALAEAKSAYEDLGEEPEEKILAFAQNFGWKLETNTQHEMPYEFALNFSDYLRNATHLQDGKWKLVNRILLNGKIFLSKNEAARLLQEEIRKYVEKRLETKELPGFPPQIIERAERIKNLSLEKVGKSEMEGFPKTIVQEAFPPCIKALYEAFATGRHLSHVGRFTLTSFLINIGMPSDKVIELFKSFSDFNERLTQYQVQHIAGERGSRTHYTSPKCDTLKTHGICINPDKTCQRLRHPLGYYRRKLKSP